MTDELSAKQVAEDYRIQRQAADARRSAFPAVGPDQLAVWIRDNPAVLQQLARDNGTPEEEIANAVLEYVTLITEQMSISPTDDPSIKLILSGLVEQVEEVCRKMAIPVGEGVVFGVAHRFGLTASQMPVLETRSSIIDVTVPFVAFCNQISKAVAATLVYSPVEGSDLYQVSNDPLLVQRLLNEKPEVLREWSLLLVWYAAYGWGSPSKGVGKLVGPEQVVRIQILQAMELFAVAHEYGHHVLEHGLSQSSSETTNPFFDEHEADVFARMISIHVGGAAPSPNFYAFSGVGGVLILGALDLVTRAKSVLRTGSDRYPPRRRHPPFAERVARIAEADQFVPASNRGPCADARDCFSEILETIWRGALPFALKMHAEGLRPDEDAPDPTGWLPLSS